MKKHFTTTILVILLIIGLGLLLYPSLSNYYNSFHQTRAITDYESSVSNIAEEEYAEMIAAAEKYNTAFVEAGTLFTPTDDRLREYDELLNPNGSGMMGYIEIPSIRVSLPLYHGTDESVLQFASEHILWSSLPVGGENTHCIVSGHRGLPSAKLFTDLDDLREGDTFRLCILNETLTYEVDEIRVVLPEEAEKLNLIPDGDYCTLITCTPYAINTHRLLVRGHRIATKAIAKVASEAVQVDKLVISAIIAVPVFLFMVLFVMIRYRGTRKSFGDYMSEIEDSF